MKIVRIVGSMALCASLLCMLSPPTSASTIVTIADGTSSVDFELDCATSPTGMINWEVGTVDQLVTEWFFVSVNGGDIVALSNPTLYGTSDADLDGVDDTLGVYYPLVDTTGTTDVTVGSIFLKFTLHAGTGFSSDIAEQIQVTAGDDGITSMEVYEYCNFVLGGTADDYVAKTNLNTVDQVDLGLRLSETVATPPPDNWQVGTAGTVLAAVLNGALDGSSGWEGPGNMAWAFEFDDGPIAANETGDLISKDKKLNSDGGRFIPEPVTMLGMFLGLGGVGAYIRKRRMM